MFAPSARPGESNTIWKNLKKRYRSADYGQAVFRLFLINTGHWVWTFGAMGYVSRIEAAPNCMA